LDPRIAAFINDLETSDPLKATLVKSVRSLYADAQPAIEETFIYGGIGFFLGKELIGGVFAHTNHVSVEFSTGNGLSDPARCLEGKGKSRRHLKLRQITDLEDKQVGSFVRQVAQP
jgi:hypothetical protein